MNAREMLVDTLTHLSPGHTLDSLTPEDADRRLPGANHSVAEIVAHMNFWASWFCDRCEGTHTPMVQQAASGWPAVAPGSWVDVQRQFLTTLDRAVRLGDDASARHTRITPAIEFPPLAEYTISDALVHVSVHTAHHLGQVVVLRQMMGKWPPPSGSWTW